MASERNDGLIDLENLVRDIDAPEGKVASEAADPKPDTAAESSRLAGTGETVPEAVPETVPAETGLTGSEQEVLTASPIKEPKKLDESAELQPQPETLPEVAPAVALDHANLSDEDFDSLLMTESPELAEEVSKIREVAKTPLEGGDSVEAIDDVLTEEAEVGVWTRLSRHFNVVLLKAVAFGVSLKTFLLRLVRDSKGVLLEVLAHVKVSLRTVFLNRKAQLGAAWKWFSSRTIGQRLSIVMAIAIAGLAGAVVYRLANGTLLPETKREWVANFAELADGAFQYEASEPMEDFNDPILHPEFVVTIDRVVVNLKRTPDADGNSNPMAAFEFYIQADSQIGAIEVKDRNVEIRDQIARAVEQMTYPELATDDGKARLKLVLRKQLNEIMTKGRVRRVYFKTIVLNPE